MRAAGVLAFAVAARAYAPAPLSRRPRAVRLNVATEDPATVSEETVATRKSSLRAAPARPGAGNLAGDAAVEVRHPRRGQIPTRPGYPHILPTQQQPGVAIVIL